MPIEIRMPKLSDTMEEGTVLAWKVGVGDRVSRGDLIAEVETDKAAMEMEAFEEGVMLELRVEAGSTVPVGTVIALLGEQGREAPRQKSDRESQRVEAQVEIQPGDEGRTEVGGLLSRDDPDQRAESSSEEDKSAALKTESAMGMNRKISASALELAREEGVDPRLVRGTGPGGRVGLSDVKLAVLEGGREMQRRTSVDRGRRERNRMAMAKKMAESWKSIPHFNVSVQIDAALLEQIHKKTSLSINTLIILALCGALQQHPEVNAHMKQDGPATQKQIGLCIALDTPDGLYNPVLKDCAQLGGGEIEARVKDLAEKAIQGELATEDFLGGTFTLSNLGMMGIHSFSAIITPPQVAVLAAGTIVRQGDAVRMMLTLSADHRALDGATAARFLGTLKALLQSEETFAAGSGS